MKKNYEQIKLYQAPEIIMANENSPLVGSID